MDVSNILLLQRIISTLFFCSFVQVFLQSSMHLLHLTDIAKLFAKELYKFVCFSISLVSLYLNQHWILSNFSFGTIWYVKQDITLLFLIFLIQHVNIFTYTYWSFLLFFLYIASSYQFFLKKLNVLFLFDFVSYLKNSEVVPFPLVYVVNISNLSLTFLLCFWHLIGKSINFFFMALSFSVLSMKNFFNQKL